MKFAITALLTIISITPSVTYTGENDSDYSSYPNCVDTIWRQSLAIVRAARFNKSNMEGYAAVGQLSTDRLNATIAKCDRFGRHIDPGHVMDRAHSEENLPDLDRTITKSILTRYPWVLSSKAEHMYRFAQHPAWNLVDTLQRMPKTEYKHSDAIKCAASVWHRSLDIVHEAMSYHPALLPQYEARQEKNIKRLNATLQKCRQPITELAAPALEFAPSEENLAHNPDLASIIARQTLMSQPSLLTGNAKTFLWFIENPGWEAVDQHYKRSLEKTFVPLSAEDASK
jgi:hypothetical protein